MIICGQKNSVDKKETALSKTAAEIEEQLAEINENIGKGIKTREAKEETRI